MSINVSPSFPGDGDAIFEFVQSNIRYPQDALRERKEGDVYVRFTVMYDGTFNNVHVVRSSGVASLDAEAIRVVQSMPQWDPSTGIDKNKTWDNVIPVRFRL